MKMSNYKAQIMSPSPFLAWKTFSGVRCVAAYNELEAIEHPCTQWSETETREQGFILVYTCMSAEARRCSTEGMISACKVFCLRHKANSIIEWKEAYRTLKMRYLWFMVYCMQWINKWVMKKGEAAAFTECNKWNPTLQWVKTCLHDKGTNYNFSTMQRNCWIIITYLVLKVEAINIPFM